MDTHYKTGDMKDCSGSSDLHRCRCRYGEKDCGWYSLCPTLRTSFMDLVLQTPPSWLSKPSNVLLDVAEREEEKNELAIVIILFKINKSHKTCQEHG